MRHHAHPQVGLANFPEGTDRVFVVNAPSIVARAFGAISPLLPEATRQKVKLIDEAGTRAALEKLIEPAEIPAFLGGERFADRLMMPCALPVPRSPINLDAPPS